MTQRKRIDTEVYVAGGSLEGCIAALQLAGQGKKVLLTEKKGSLGGAASNGMEIFLSPERVEQEQGREYAEALLERAGQREGLKGPVFHDQKCKLVLAEMLRDAGVTVLTHIFPFEINPCDTEMVCLADCKTEILEIHCRAMIDAQPFGECLEEWEEGSLKAQGAVKWSGIPKEALQDILEPGYTEEDDFLQGTVNLGYVWTKDGITYGNGSVKCSCCTKFGETVMGGIPIELPDTSVVTLSRAEAGMRSYAYRLREKLRSSRKGFEQASIICVAPEIGLYGIRKRRKLQEGRLFAMNLQEYSNEAAIMTGVSVAESVADFLRRA